MALCNPSDYQEDKYFLFPIKVALQISLCSSTYLIVSFDTSKCVALAVVGNDGVKITVVCDGHTHTLPHFLGTAETSDCSVARM